MRLDQLKVLDAIVRTGSFRAAAEELHRAQSAVSYAVKNLESDLGVQLFSRDAYRPTLTAEGQAVHAKARAVLAGAGELESLARQLAQGWEPVVRLAVSALFPLPTLTRALRDFAGSTPETRVQLTIEVLAGADRVQSDRADVAVAELLDPAPLGDVELCPGGQVEMVPVAAPAHPLAQVQGPLARSLLFAHVHVILSSPDPGATAGRTAGILEGATTWSTSEFGAKKTLLLDGLGWGLMPAHLVAEELAAGTLRRLDIPEYRDFRTTLHLMRRRQGAPGRGAVRLWELLRERCGEVLDQASKP